MSPQLKSLFFAGLLLAGPGMAAAGVKPGDVFPSLAGAELAGGALPVTAGKVVLVDFWASWCAPCKASFPAYARLYDEYAPRGLVLIAVSVDENPAAYAAFVKRHAPPFTTLRDSRQRLVKLVAVPTMPTSYLVGRDGRVRYLHPGFHGDETIRELNQEIAELLGQSPPASP